MAAQASEASSQTLTRDLCGHGLDVLRAAAKLAKAPITKVMESSVGACLLFCLRAVLKVVDSMHFYMHECVCVYTLFLCTHIFQSISNIVVHINRSMQAHWCCSHDFRR